MSTLETRTSLQQQLAARERELRLINGIDHIRDSIHEPTGMLAAIVHLLAEDLQANLCLLSLKERETGELVLKAMYKNGQKLSDLLPDLVHKGLAERAIALDHATLWVGAEIRPGLGAEVQLTAVPIILNANQHLGALLLARLNHPFTPDEISLLDLLEDHIDSAVIQGYHWQDLEQRNRELETIYRIDHIRDGVPSFDDLLDRVLAELQKTLHTEVGFIMLYNHAQDRLESRIISTNLFDISSETAYLESLAHRALHEGQLIWDSQPYQQVHSAMCLPLILNHRIIGVLGVANGVERHGRGFSANDRRLLSAIGSQIDTAIFETMERRHMREVLGRAVDPRIMERLLESADDLLKGERRIVTVLYADIRGSTSLAEEVDPELLVSFINDYLGTMTEVIFRHEGTLDKFVGDEVMALFGAPHTQTDHAVQAMKAGLAMQAAHAQLLARWRHQLPSAPLGVGIATGELIVGEMGSAQRTDYTVLGRAANLGSRICSVAQGGQVLLCPETYRLLAEQAPGLMVNTTAVDGLQFKGISGRMTVYNILGYNESEA